MFFVCKYFNKIKPVGPVFYHIMHDERLCPWKHLFIGRGLKQHRYKKYPSAFYTSIHLIFKRYLLWCTEKISIGIKFFFNVSNFSPFHHLLAVTMILSSLRSCMVFFLPRSRTQRHPHCCEILQHIGVDWIFITFPQWELFIVPHKIDYHFFCRCVWILDILENWSIEENTSINFK